MNSIQIVPIQTLSNLRNQLLSVDLQAPEIVLSYDFSQRAPVVNQFLDKLCRRVPAYMNSEVLLDVDCSVGVFDGGAAPESEIGLITLRKRVYAPYLTEGALALWVFAGEIWIKKSFLIEDLFHREWSSTWEFLNEATYATTVSATCLDI